MKKLTFIQRARLRITSAGLFWLPYILLVTLLLAYFLTSWLDSAARLAATEGRLAERELQIIAMLEGKQIRLGDGHYAQCATSNLIRSIVEGS